MKRIDFFKQLFMGGALLFAPKLASPTGTKELKEIKFISPYIAGFQYYEGKNLEHMLKLDDLLSLKREPENRHDWYAIGVYRGSHKLGYVPRAENRIIARIMDQGMTVQGRIIKLDAKAIPNRRVKMKVYYEMGEA